MTRGNSWNGKDIDDCLDALAVHYHLNCLYSELPYQLSDMLSSMNNKEIGFWRGLAWGLMRDFVPAFGEEKPKAGRPKEIHTKVDGLFPHAHDARLVQIVRALRSLLTARDMPSTNTAAYNQLLKILRMSPAPLWRYGKYRAVS